MFMHLHNRSARAAMMCLAAGSMFCFGLAPALAGGTEGGSRLSAEKNARLSAAAKAKAEAAKRKKLQQCCTRSNKALRCAQEAASRAIRQAVYAFHDATDDDAATLLTDEQIGVLALTAQGQMADALASGMTALMAAHDKALADLTAAGASQEMLDKLEMQTTAAKARLQAMADCAARKLNELVAKALAANDMPAPDPTPEPGETEPSGS